MNSKAILNFTLGVACGILATMLWCYLTVWRMQPETHPAALADKKITEMQLSPNTYIYSVNHSDAELADLDDGTLLNRMAQRTTENGMSRFVMIKINPKMFCSAVATHPAANVIVMRPITNETPPEIVQIESGEIKNVGGAEL